MHWPPLTYVAESKNRMQYLNENVHLGILLNPICQEVGIICVTQFPICQASSRASGRCAKYSPTAFQALMLEAYVDDSKNKTRRLMKMFFWKLY